MEAIVEAIRKVAKELMADSDHGMCLALVVPPDSPLGELQASMEAEGKRETWPHVTVIYLGKGVTDEEGAKKRVTEGLAQIGKGPIKLVANGTATLGRYEKAAVITLAPNERLRALHVTMLAALAHLIKKEQFLSYLPHVTVTTGATGDGLNIGKGAECDCGTLELRSGDKTIETWTL